MTRNQLPKGMYSIKEFSSWSTLGVTRIYKEISIGRLKIVKIGRRTVITAEAAEEWRAQLGIK